MLVVFGAETGCERRSVAVETTLHDVDPREAAQVPHRPVQAIGLLGVPRGSVWQVGVDGGERADDVGVRSFGGCAVVLEQAR